MRRGLVDGVWAIVAQALSSVTNFGVLIILAHVSSPHLFGATAVALTLDIFAVNIARAVAGDPYIIYASGERPDDQERMARASSALAGFVGLACALVSVPVWSLMFDADIMAVPLVILCATPLLCLQDHLRLVAISTGRTHEGILAEIIWIAAQGSLSFVLFLREWATPMWLLTAWMMGATAAVLIVTLRLRVIPDATAVWAWVRKTKPIIAVHAVEYIIVAGMAQVALIVIAASVGLEAGGAIRGAMLILAPPTVLLAGLVPYATSRAVVALRRGKMNMVRSSGGLAAVTVGVTVFWGGVALGLPARYGEALLGEQWAIARKTLPFMVVSAVALASAVPAIVGLRSRRAVRAALRRRSVAALFFPIGGVVGGVLWNTVGATAGLAVAQTFDAIAVWVSFCEVSAAAERRDLEVPSDERLRS